jgi:LysR family nitrogen assimilation transcriptional regulator
MDLRYLRTFVTVAELGTVSKAALSLHIAQPALSRQISKLEEELGLKLFNRIGRRMVLSGEGEQLLGDCRGLLNYSRSLGERAQLLRQGDTGLLKVAASPHFIEGIFPVFLQRYAQRYPKVKVKLTDTVGPEQLAMLERGDIDLAQSLVRAIPPESQHFESYLLQPTDMLAACHPDLKLGKGATVEISHLAPYPLLQISSEFVIRRTFDAACRLAGFKPDILIESRAPHALLALAEAGHGVAIIPSALRTHQYKLHIARITYRGRPLLEPLTMLSDKRRLLPSYAIAFCEMLADYVREVFPITSPSEPETVSRVKRTSARTGINGKQRKAKGRAKGHF